MARKNNKECTICHKKYLYCPTCDEFAREPFWKNMFCSQECVNAYEIFNKYVSGVIDKGQAKIALEKIEIDFEQLRGSFAQTYNEIMQEEAGEQVEEDKEVEIEKIEKDIALITKDAVIANATSEAKAIYPKSVKHKKRY